MLNKMKGAGLKTSLKMIISYFLICTVGTILLACLYMIYSSCTLLIAGDAFNVFSRNLFFSGLVKALPICIAVSSIFLALYLIRHPSEVLVPLITYLILGFVSWFILLPLTTVFSAKMKPFTVIENDERPVSENYFRESNDQIVYISSYNANGYVDGTVVELSPTERGVFSFTDIPLAERTSEFSDSLIERTVTVPDICSVFVKGINVLFNTGTEYWSRGFIYWICFASVGIALLSLLGLKRMSSWRLINVFSIMAMAVIIFIANAAYYGVPQLQKYTFAVDQWFIKYTVIPNPCAVLFNTVITLIFTVWGIINAVVNAPEKTKKQKRPKKQRVKKAKKVKPAKLPVADMGGFDL